MAEPIPPGWYADPGQPGTLRYWDGTAWTEQRASAPAPAAAAGETNGLAIASFVLSLAWAFGIGSVLAVIFGFKARSQIRTRNQSGEGLAVAGIVIGFLGLVPAAILLLLVVFGSFASITLDSVGGGETGSGTIETVSPSVTDFSRLEVGVSFDVQVRVGSEFGLVIRADDNVIDAVRASVNGETLTLGLDGNYRDITLEATVTVPRDALAFVGTSGAATVSGQDRLVSDVFVIEASGASRVVIGLDSNDLTVTASGASTVEATGSGDVVDGEASGSSSVLLGGFDATTVTANSSGASTMVVTASESLDATASGASKIRYGGEPSEITTDASGGSTIESE